MMLLQILLASSPIIIYKYARSESSDSLSDLSPLVSGASPILTVPPSPTSVSMLSSSDDSMQGVTGDSEQPDYPVQPVTPGEEELMRIHEDGGYCPPDMIEMRDQRGLAAWFAESVVRNREALSRPYTLDSVSEVEALLVDSEPEDDPPEHRITSVSPPAEEKSLTPEAEDCRGNS